tara:strand:- start:38 stop:907 length:870 start_codon:yes stop_codon:yes gene_type:complete
MDTGAGSSTIPNFDSNFPVGFAFYRQPASSQSWEVGARLTQGKYLVLNTNAAEGNYAKMSFDSNVGFQNESNHDSTYQAWMWKRHAGFDVVTYKARGGDLASYPHSLGKIPEMIWVKMRNSSQDWNVYHKGLNGGSSPEGYYMLLNTTDAEASSTTRWGNTAPTAYSFYTGGHTGTNYINYEYIAMLFASVDGISKVGSYTGNSTAGHEISVGFAPRFLIIKPIEQTYGWFVVDTTRGWGSGDDEVLTLNSSTAESGWGFGAPTSTGFELNNDGAINQNGKEYIYYCHA